MSVLEGKDVRMPEVKVENLGSLVLVGLIIREILNQNLERPENQQRIKKMNLNLVIQASRQVITLKIKQGEVSLANGADPEADVKVRGEINDFLDLALFKLPVKSFLKGKLRLSGKIYKLPGFIPLIMV